MYINFHAFTFRRFVAFALVGIMLASLFAAGVTASGSKEGARPSVEFSADYVIAEDTTRPPTPTLISPPNGAVVWDRTPWLEWGDVVDPSGVTYHLQVSRGIAFNQIVYEKLGILPSHHELENALQPGMHFWRVRAVDGAGNASEWSEIWRFRINGKRRKSGD